MRNKKLKPLLTRTAFLIPTILVFTGSTKSEAMFKNAGLKLGKVLKSPAVSSSLPKLNAIKINKPASSASHATNSLQRPSSSVGSSNSNKPSASVGIYQSFKGPKSITQKLAGNGKRPAYNPNKGPAPQPPKLQPIYDTPYDPIYDTPYEPAAKNPIYKNVTSKGLSARPLPPLPSNGKNLGSSNKLQIKNGKVVNNSIYQNVLHLK